MPAELSQLKVRDVANSAKLPLFTLTIDVHKQSCFNNATDSRVSAFSIFFAATLRQNDPFFVATDCSLLSIFPSHSFSPPDSFVDRTCFRLKLWSLDLTAFCRLKCNSVLVTGVEEPAPNRISSLRGSCLATC